MKKLLTSILFLCLGIAASAGFVLSVDGVLYDPDATINLTSGIHAFTLYSSEEFTPSSLCLTLSPKAAAHFVTDIIIIDPIPEDMDILIPFPDPFIADHFDFTVYFFGPAADFALYDPELWEPTDDTWHLVPEPATMLLIGLGGLAMRTRKK